VEFHGTYPLPEAQLDRFAMKFSLGYVSPEQEVAILLAQGKTHPINKLQSCISFPELQLLQKQVKEIRISPELLRYIVDITSATRRVDEVKLGASPRASLTLMKCAQALALIDGSEFVTPEIIQELAVPVIAHRLGLDSQSQFSGIDAESLVRDIVQTTPAPL